MILNYLKIAFRNLVKNKLYSLVNIFGLAMGMAACFFIIQYVYFESGYDSFNKNAKDLYRVAISYTGGFSDGQKFVANHPGLGRAMKTEFPEVKGFSRVVRSSIFIPSCTFSVKEKDGAFKVFSEDKLFFADSSFFTLFTYPFISGDPAKALTDANTVVISDSLARKLFGQEDAMGKTIFINGGLPFKITGVIREVPENSHIKFNAMASIVTGPVDYFDHNWAWPEFYTYVLLNPGADPKKTEAKFPAFIENHLGAIMKEYKFRCQFFMQPVRDIHLHSNYSKEAEVNGSKTEIVFLSIIGAFILIIAWINYINLSTVKSMERAKEVGLRKVVGAGRLQLITQFLFESVVINFIAVTLAIAMVILLNPAFSRFIGKNMNDGFFANGMGVEPYFWAGVLFIFAMGSLLVGSYPAFVLSSFRPIIVLKGIVVRTNSRISLRRVLVSFQFILSIILIAATLIVSNQLTFMRQQKLGYNGDQMLIIKSPGVTDSTIADKFRYFRTELARNPDVQGMSASSDVPGRTIIQLNGTRRSMYDKTHNLTAFQMEIDENFKNTYGIAIAAGRNLTRNDTSSMLFTTEPAKVLVNEELVHLLGFKNNEEALNQFIVTGFLTGETTCQIVGVTVNYHQRSPKENYDPILYYYPAWNNWKYFSVSMNTGKLNQDLTKIESVYKSSFPGNPVEYFFLDDYFNQQYQSDQRLGKVFGLFASLAIIVACLGLLGLSSYVIKVRTKEIGIRKVLGASVSSIMVLFSKDFVRLVAIASVIAIPLIYFFADRWLTNYAFRIHVGVIILLLPSLLLLIIALITICLQSLKAAMGNPAGSLRSE
ncbi:MAG: ABC transporter permease [Flavitalea sp.]